MVATYPVSGTAKANELGRLMGPFWTEIYPDSATVRQLLTSLSEQLRQLEVDLTEWLDSVDRHNIPLFDRKIWYRWRIYDSQITNSDASVWRLDSGYSLDSNNTPPFDTAADALVSINVPGGLQRAGLIVNRIAQPTAVMCAGTDFEINDGVARFYYDPRILPFKSGQVFTNGEVTDTYWDLWLYDSSWETYRIWYTIGFLLSGKHSSSELYRRLVNQLLDAVVGGTSQGNLLLALGTLLGLEFCRSRQETVEELLSLNGTYAVVTDKYVYTSGSASQVTASQQVEQGQPLFDGVVVIDGRLGDFSSLPSVLLNKQLADVSGDLIFQNRILTVDTDSDPSFLVDGEDAAVAEFWSAIDRTQLVEFLSQYDYDESINPVQHILPGLLSHVLFVVLDEDTPVTTRFSSQFWKTWRQLWSPYQPVRVCCSVPKLTASGKLSDIAGSSAENLAMPSTSFGIVDAAGTITSSGDACYFTL